MFTLSVTKILLTLGVGLAVWAFYRIMVRRKAIPELDLRTRLRGAWRGAIRPEIAEPRVSLARCPGCGDYISEGSRCTRSGCPEAA